MALIVEDGTGKVDAESYISVADANTYHTGFGNSAWTGDDALKEQALRRATRFIDGLYSRRWVGLRNSQAQALDWPREYAYDKDEFLVPNGTVPTAVKRATAEAALRELQSPNSLTPDLERGGQVESESVSAGPVSSDVTYRPDAPVRPILTVLDDLLHRLTASPNSARVLRG